VEHLQPPAAVVLEVVAQAILLTLHRVALEHLVRAVRVEQGHQHLRMAVVVVAAHLPLAGCNLEQPLALAALAQHHQLQDHQSLMQAAAEALLLVVLILAALEVRAVAVPVEMEGLLEQQALQILVVVAAAEAMMVQMLWPAELVDLAL